MQLDGAKCFYLTFDLLNENVYDSIIILNSLITKVMKRNIIKLWIFPILLGFMVALSTSCEEDDNVLDDPGNLTSYRDKVGETFKFTVTGTDTDAATVWGGANGIYTDDSLLAKAAVHAGKVRLNETKVVTVTILPGQSSYIGSTQNGITTVNFGAWPGSYRFE